MKTETLLEECILLAHRINKLGDCVFVYDYGHIDEVAFRIAKSKRDYESKTIITSYYYTDASLNEFSERMSLEELHIYLTETLKTLQEESNE